MNTDLLRDWMLERQRIYLRRVAGDPPPWTDDDVLAAYRFCNVYREQDTVTQWIDEHIRKPYAERESLWFMLAIARYVNRTDTLGELIGTSAWPDHKHFTPTQLGAALQDRADRKLPVYTGAYMIRAESDPKKGWYNWSKHDYIAKIVLGRLWDDRHFWTRVWRDATAGAIGLQQVWEQFQMSRYVGWGPFMAYEVVTDLRHTRYLRNAPDIYTWANAGPGALRGLNRISYRPLNKGIPKGNANAEMRQIMEYFNRLDTGDMNGVFGLPRVRQPRFEMRDIEHSLCEMDKWLRVKNGEGRPRSKYNPKKATILKGATSV